MLGLVVSALVAFAGAKKHSGGELHPRAHTSVPNITGYLVTAQWAESVKDHFYGLDVTRQNTAFAVKQELVLQNLEPEVEAPVGVGSVLTAFDPLSRLYFATASNGTESLANFLWTLNISSDVENSTSVASVSFPLFEQGATVVSLQAININGAPQVLAIYQTGEIYSVDYKTGKATSVARFADGTKRFVTPAVAYDSKTKRLFAVTQSTDGQPQRNISTLDVTTWHVTSIAQQPLKNEIPFEEDPFAMVWVESLQVLLEFQTGNFDQIKYVDPTSGEQSWAVFDLSQFNGIQGHFEIVTNQGMINDDAWPQMVVAPEHNLVYFQCSDVDPAGGLYTTALCMGPIYDKIKSWDYVNPAVEPFQYGYAGFQYVPVLA